MKIDVFVRYVDSHEDKVRQFYLELAALTIERPFVEVHFLPERYSAKELEHLMDSGREFIDSLMSDIAAKGYIVSALLTDRSFIEIKVPGEDAWPVVMPAVGTALELLTCGEPVEFHRGNHIPLSFREVSRRSGD